MFVGGGMAEAAAQAQLAQQDYLNAQRIYQQMAMQQQMYGGGMQQMYPGMYPGNGIPGATGMFPGMFPPGMPIDRNAQLIEGVKNGQINKQEFVSLGNFRNETERLRAKMGADGLSPYEQMYLRQRESQYDQMYQRYSYGDYHPRTQANDQTQQRQLNQMGRIFDGLHSGQLNRGEGRQLIDQQQGISRNKGFRQADGNLGWWDRMALNQQLDNSSFNIFNLKHNWVGDGGARQWPPIFFPQRNPQMMLFGGGY